MSKSLSNFYFLEVVITTAILLLARTSIGFVYNIRIAKHSFPGSPAKDRTGNSFSFTLAASGFGKAPTGKSLSSKKKKFAKTKRTKSPSFQTSTYIPYNLEPGVLTESSSSKHAIRALLEWLDEEEVEGLEGVEIGYSKSDGEDTENSSPGLRGIFAKRDFRPGEYIMAVPYVSTLLVDEDFDPSTIDPGTVVLRADKPEVGFRFWEMYFSPDSEGNDNEKYKAFLDCLPMTPDDPNFDGTPDFWSEEDIRRLEIPGVVDKMLSRKKAMAGFANKLSGNEVIEKGNNEDTASALATIQQCLWLVQSRAFTTYKKARSIDGSVGLLSRVVLIPFIDMINHASRIFSNAEMQVVETKEYDESFYALVATEPIQKGTQIQICYGTGEETSLEIFSKYGFWPEVENREREKEALQKLLEGVEWSTTLEEDQAMLETELGRREPMRTTLSVRIYAKSHVL